MTRRPGPPSPVQLDRRPLPKVHLSADHSRSDVDALVRTRTWERVRAGAYVPVIACEDPHARRRRHALARIVALATRADASPVFAVTSAALVWGLPMPTPSTVTHVVQRSRPTSHGAPDVARHHLDLPASQVTEHRGVRVTTLERTVVDCATRLPPLAGLIVADAALHIGADRDLCLEILHGLGGRRGVVRARAVLEVADAGSESPGETHMRFTALALGLAVPETQIRIVTRAGVFWSDMGWRGWRLLCEYDGRAKYEARGASADAVLDEKRRQEAIEEEGWRLLRLARGDLGARSDLLDRVSRHLPAPPHLTRRPALSLP